MTPLIAIIVLIIVIAVAAYVNAWAQSDEAGEFSAREEAERLGEDVVERDIRSVLRTGDEMFRNVKIDVGGSEREFDFIIANENGVFVIETKNYSGILTGTESDYNWGKYRVSRGGNVYFKEARNPIAQAESQSGFLGRYLRSLGIRVWVEGYAAILGADSPVESERVMKNAGDVDRVIHTPGRHRLDPADVEKIKRILT